MKETCEICNNNYVLTFKAPHTTCTVSCNASDMMLHEVLQDLVLPAVQGVGFSVSPGYLDVCYHEENGDTF
jgi:hypothetical protein